MKPAYSDPELLNWTLNIAQKFNLTTFLETGTYKGESAKIVSQYFQKVITIENNHDNYKDAVYNLKDVINCKPYFGNSPEIMNIVLEEYSNNTFFFLDAHWDEYWPILDELKIIKNKKIKPVIAIHDFFVPDENKQAKFGFDSYNNQPLDINYIKNALNEIYDGIFKVKYSSTSETNSGVVYICPII